MLLDTTSASPLGSEILHTFIDPPQSWFVLNQSFVADVCKTLQSLLWSPSLGLHCVFTPAPLGKKSSSFSAEWRHRHLVSIHLLIAAGYGDQLGLAWYLAFIMPLCFKRGLRKYCQSSLHPQKCPHDPPSAFRGDQVNPPEKRPSCTQGLSTGTSFFIIMIVCQHCAPCPLSFWNRPIYVYPSYSCLLSWQFAYPKLPIKPTKISMALLIIFFSSTRIHHSWHNRTKGGCTAGGWLVGWVGWCTRCIGQGVTVELPHSLVSRPRQKG